MVSEPVALYVAAFNDREYLVTIWSDGVADLAIRDDPAWSWGPPIRMESRPTRLGDEW